MRLVLASQSPRRAELLGQMGLPFERYVADIDESRHSGEPAADYVLRLAAEKAAAGFAAVIRPSSSEPSPVAVLGADTIVVCDDEILGKPRGPKEGMAMLQRLAGRTHQVLTGVAVQTELNSRTVLSRSNVTFRDISPAEVRQYWDTGEGADKAGSYGIQGFGGIFVTHLDGSFSGVMGLPVMETEALLQALNIDTWKLRGSSVSNG
ncbi:MAG: Maf family protein [Pseudomonadota bacterium]